MIIFACRYTGIPVYRYTWPYDRPNDFIVGLFMNFFSNFLAFIKDIKFFLPLCRKKYLPLQAVREEVSHMKNNLDIMSDNQNIEDDDEYGGKYDNFPQISSELEKWS